MDVMFRTNNTEITDTPVWSSRTAFAIGVAAVIILVLMIIAAAIAGCSIMRRVKGRRKLVSSTLPCVHYQPRVDIGIENAVYSPGNSMKTYHHNAS